MSKKKLAVIIAVCIIAIIAVIVITNLREPTPPTETYTLTTNISPSGTGSISPSGGEYESGEQVTLTATPASGYTFDYWSGSASGATHTITITMDSDKSLTAYFETIPTVSYNLTVSVNGQGTTNPSAGTYEYDSGTEITITASPASGWEFDHWSGDASGTSSTIVITMDSDKGITAYFEEQPPVSSNVQITYIFYDGVVYRTESDEYVEITNLGDTSQDLKGWVLLDISEGYPSLTFPTYILQPGESIRVYTNEIHTEYGGFSFGSGKAVWNNSSPDTAVLYNDQGDEVSRKSY